jgi:hypothetical protein
VAERSALVRELERVDAQARVDGAGGARALGALVQQLRQALREGAGLLEVLGRHPDFAVGPDAMARAPGEPPLHVIGGGCPERLLAVGAVEAVSDARLVAVPHLRAAWPGPLLLVVDHLKQARLCELTRVVARGGVSDYDSARPETLDGLPINHSGTHVDFMIGSPDLTVTSVRRDGTRHRILEGERWVL